MNLNKEFLSEIISYLINRGVTLTDVLDTFNEHFNTSDNAIKHEHEKHDEVRKPITDIDLLLCGRELEKQGFNKDIKERVTVTENITESPYKLVPTPPTKVSLSPNKRDQRNHEEKECQKQGKCCLKLSKARLFSNT